MSLPRTWTLFLVPSSNQPYVVRVFSRARRLERADANLYLCEAREQSEGMFAQTERAPSPIWWRRSSDCGR
jgi:hypothetical protein